jgi:O-antigen ligase
VAWSLGAFGGVYPWTALPIVVGSFGLALAVPPRFGGSPALRWLDAALACAGAAALAALVPLPIALAHRLSPHLAAFDAAYRVDAGLAAARSASTWRPLALAPAATAYTCLVMGAVVVLFWTGRTALAYGGARRLARGIAWIGFAASLLAIVQRAVSPGRIYGWWEPLERGAQPFGPMVNRNDFATWLLVALPVTVGYLAAHVRSHASDWRGPRGPVRWLRRLDTRTIWLSAAGVLMLVALARSQSRGAAMSLLVAAVVWVRLARRRAEAGTWWLLAGFAALAAAALAAWANLGMLLQRFDDLAIEGASGRRLIWRDTVRVIRDFWLTGVGLGGYEAAMTVFQQSSRDVFFNHAHNQYLQLAAEGGLLVSLPAAVAVVAFGRAARAALRADRSPMWHVRAGAVTGVAAVAVQSVWESGLITPANAVLVAVAAALAIFRPERLERRPRGS